MPRNHREKDASSLASLGIERKIRWCREGDSNPHAPFRAADFKLHPERKQSTYTFGDLLPENCDMLRLLRQLQSIPSQ